VPTVVLISLALFSLACAGVFSALLGLFSVLRWSLDRVGATARAPVGAQQSRRPLSPAEVDAIERECEIGPYAPRVVGARRADQDARRPELDAL